MEDIDAEKILSELRPEHMDGIDTDKTRLYLIRRQVINEIMDPEVFVEPYFQRRKNLLLLIGRKGLEAYYEFVRALEEDEHFQFVYYLSKQEMELVSSKLEEKTKEMKTLQNQLSDEERKAAILEEGLEKSLKEVTSVCATVKLELDQSRKYLEEERKRHEKTRRELEELEKSHKEGISVREPVELELDQSRKYLEEERKQYEKTWRELEARSEKGKLDESTRVARLENIRRNNLAKLKSQRAEGKLGQRQVSERGSPETMPRRSEEPANSSRTRNIAIRECLQNVGEMDQAGTTMEPRVDEPPRRQQNTGSNEPLKTMPKQVMEEAALKRAIEKSILEYIAGHENLEVLKEMNEIIVRKVKEEFSGTSRKGNE